MNGKQYLIELTENNYPVIPTIDDINNFEKLPKSDFYIIKPKDGADSIGLEKLSDEELLNKNLKGKKMLIEPAIDFEYEVSFYFINEKFEYSMYTPNSKKNVGNSRNMHQQKMILNLQENSLNGMILNMEFKEWMHAEQKQESFY